MKVILLKDVAKIGRRFEVVEVPHGYALNKLIPAGQAQEATPANLKRVQSRSAKLEASQAVSATNFLAAFEKVTNATIAVSVEANEKGHLFEAIKPDSIARTCAELGAPFTAEQIVIAKPIKEVGTHEIVVQEGELSRPLTITVVSAK